jgi:hypothetical protein
MFCFPLVSWCCEKRGRACSFYALALSAHHGLAAQGLGWMNFMGFNGLRSALDMSDSDEIIFVLYRCKHPWSYYM